MDGKWGEGDSRETSSEWTTLKAFVHTDSMFSNSTIFYKHIVHTLVMCKIVNTNIYIYVSMYKPSSHVCMYMFTYLAILVLSRRLSLEIPSNIAALAANSHPPKFQHLDLNSPNY
jgi:hypothetical protein